MLGHYIKSFKKGLFDDKKLPSKWIAWKIILDNLRGHQRYTFSAMSAEEYVESIRNKLPHLNDSDLKFLYDKINENKTSYDYYFAGPPLLIDNAYRNLETGKTSKNINNKLIFNDNEYYLAQWGVERLPSSYTDNSLPKERGEPRELAFSEKSLSYAREHWHYVLQVQPPMKKRHQYFSNPDPTTQRILWGARTMFELFYCEGSDFADIELITYDSIIFEEFEDRAYWNPSSAICVYDGSALGKRECNTCKRKFSEELHLMHGGPPINDRIMSFLKEYEDQIRSQYKIFDGSRIVPDEELLKLSREKYREYCKTHKWF